MRDIGAMASPQNSFYTNLGLETLFLRVERHVSNAEKVAAYLSEREKDGSITWVNYPSLPGNKYYELARKYMPNGTCGVIFLRRQRRPGGRREIHGGSRLAAIVTHVADARTCVLHPASTTHRQMNDSELAAAGVSPDLIRFSVGIEYVGDIIADIDNALKEI